MMFIMFFCVRPCGSYDALISPQQPLPNPDWFAPHMNHKQNQIYTCSSECSDNSQKHQHPAYIHQNHKQQHHHLHNSQERKNCNNLLLQYDGNDHAIYEAGENPQIVNNHHQNCESEQDRQSECCSSRDGEGDTCCSCSESSCLYAEAGEPMHQVQVVRMTPN